MIGETHIDYRDLPAAFWSAVLDNVYKVLGCLLYALLALFEASQSPVVQSLFSFCLSGGLDEFKL